MTTKTPRLDALNAAYVAKYGRQANYQVGRVGSSFAGRTGQYVHVVFQGTGSLLGFDQSFCKGYGDRVRTVVTPMPDDLQAVTCPTCSKKLARALHNLGLSAAP